MKVGLLLVTLNVVAIAQAKYELACAKSELSIRWPSYESNSDYYICPRLFGKQMTVTCNPGEVFTFVFQSCTAPNKYIPAPALEVLPTASPLLHKPNKDGYLTPVEIPNQPPVLNPLNHVPFVNIPMLQAPVKPVDIPVTPVEETKPVEKEGPAVAVVEEPVKPLAPLPPTPAPTPPVVEKQPHKKPGSTSGKKPAAKKKSSSSTPASTTEDVAKGKKPSSGKKPAPKKNGKQNPKVDKNPKKLAKKPNTLDKKPPKA